MDASTVGSPGNLGTFLGNNPAKAIIQQTETELGETTDLQLLTNYFFANRVIIGGTEIHGEAKSTWEKLLPLVLEAQRSANHEQNISSSLIHKLVQYEKQLRLLCRIPGEDGHSFLAGWHYALAAIAIVAAAVTPKVDPIDIGLVMALLMGLYAVSIVLAAIVARGTNA